jgi:hypothetical protein
MLMPQVTRSRTPTSSGNATSKLCLGLAHAKRAPSSSSGSARAVVARATTKEEDGDREDGDGRRESTGRGDHSGEDGAAGHG